MKVTIRIVPKTIDILKETFLGKPFIHHYIDIALLYNPNSIVILNSNNYDLSQIINEVDVPIVIKEKDEADIELSTDKIYSPVRISKGYTPKESIIWEVNKKKDLADAEVEFNKEYLYPIGRYYIRPLAKRIAYKLIEYFSADMVSFVDLFIGIICGLCLIKSWYLIGGIFLWLFWFVDHIDGYMARLKGTSSPFGKYLDTVIGQIGIHFIYLSLFIGLYYNTHKLYFLIYGGVAMFGNSIFQITQSERSYLREKEKNFLKDGSSIETIFSCNSFILHLKKIISFIDDTDIRFHFYILLLFLNMPEVLGFFIVGFYNIRWILNFGFEILRRYKSG